MDDEDEERFRRAVARGIRDEKARQSRASCGCLLIVLALVVYVLVSMMQRMKGQ